jgi:hypothetical protein
VDKSAEIILVAVGIADGENAFDLDLNGLFFNLLLAFRSFAVSSCNLLDILTGTE